MVIPSNFDVTTLQNNLRILFNRTLCFALDFSLRALGFA